MGQDVDHRRRTEIDAINGAIVRLGEALQVPTPVNRTLTELIHTLEAVFEEETAAASVAGR
jgi:2-dehydropantoate 2-reductase